MANSTEMKILVKFIYYKLINYERFTQKALIC